MLERVNIEQPLVGKRSWSILKLKIHWWEHTKISKSWLLKEIEETFLQHIGFNIIYYYFRYFGGLQAAWLPEGLKNTAIIFEKGVRMLVEWGGSASGISPPANCRFPRRVLPRCSGNVELPENCSRGYSGVMGMI